MLLEATSVKPRARGQSPLNKVFAAINTLPAPVKIGLYSTVGLAMTAILSGCGTQDPSVTHEIAECGGQTEIDIAPGSLEKIKAKQGGEAKVTVNEGGTITLNGMTMEVNPNEYFFGELSENHLSLEIQGDIDDDGKVNIAATSICPAPPKSIATVSLTPSQVPIFTPIPTPTPTP